MKQYIALLRGINVGGRNKISMMDLTQIFTKHKCQNIKTYIQSGNLVFTQENAKISSLIKAVKKNIKDDFGFTPEIIIISEQEFTLAISNNPFKSTTGKDLHFFFLESVPTSPNLEKIDTLKVKTEQFELIGSIFYLFAPEGIGRSKLAVNIEKNLGVTATGRNFNTIKKLESMLVSQSL